MFVRKDGDDSMVWSMFVARAGASGFAVGIDIETFVASLASQERAF